MEREKEDNVTNEYTPKSYLVENNTPATGSLSVLNPNVVWLVGVKAFHVEVSWNPVCLCADLTS